MIQTSALLLACSISTLLRWRGYFFSPSVTVLVQFLTSFYFQGRFCGSLLFSKSNTQRAVDFNVIIKQTFSYIIILGILWTNSKSGEFLWWLQHRMEYKAEIPKLRAILCSHCSLDIFAQCYLYSSWRASPLSTDTVPCKNGCVASGPQLGFTHTF